MNGLLKPTAPHSWLLRSSPNNIHHSLTQPPHIRAGRGPCDTGRALWLAGGGGPPPRVTKQNQLWGPFREQWPWVPTPPQTCLLSPSISRAELF